MRNLIRLNKEINVSVMPKDWKGGKENKISCLTLYMTKEERAKVMVKFSEYREKAYKAEIMCFILSNYIAYLSGKKYEKIAMKVWQYGRKYRTPKKYVHYSIGAIPVALMDVVHQNLGRSGFKFRCELYYHAVTSFYNAPDRVLNEMCRRINEIKHPEKKHDRSVVLQAVIPDEEYQMVKAYASQNGMNICDLMRVVLRTVCMSKKDRLYDDSPIGKVFNLYRIIKQKKEPFVVDDAFRVLTVEISGEKERYYIMKFLHLRGFSKTEILRKAVRALDDVIVHRSRIERKIIVGPDGLDDYNEDENDYWYEQMARRDFARSIYI